ncbi:MAG: NFACT RNA binding domain-containing protein, partial [Desulfovibrionales bacterium]
QQGRETTVVLDPRLSILGNMERLFRRAAKGKRGINFLVSRKQELDQELREVKNRGLAGVQLPGPVQGSRSKKKQKAKSGLAVHEFITSDGFTVFRGKNKKANHALLTSFARPQDYWFHALGGPGAHVILRRHHGEQAVPEESMNEAAVLAGLAGYQKDAGTAEVLCALVRDVRTIKGADLGQVRVDKVVQTFRVRLDPEIERSLKPDQDAKARK